MKKSHVWLLLATVALIMTVLLSRSAQASNLATLVMDLRFPDGTVHHVDGVDEFTAALIAFVDAPTDGNLVALDLDGADTVLFEKRSGNIITYGGGPSHTGTIAEFRERFPAALRQAHKQATLTLCESNEKNIGTALEMYSTDNAGRYPHSLKALTPDYLKRIPICPGAKQDSYSATYKWQVNPDGYSFYCSGANHTDAGRKPDYPQYNSSQGLVTGR